MVYWKILAPNMLGTGTLGTEGYAAELAAHAAQILVFSALDRRATTAAVFGGTRAADDVPRAGEVTLYMLAVAAGVAVIIGKTIAGRCSCTSRPAEGPVRVAGEGGGRGRGGRRRGGSRS